MVSLLKRVLPGPQNQVYVKVIFSITSHFMSYWIRFRSKKAKLKKTKQNPLQNSQVEIRQIIQLLRFKQRTFAFVSSFETTV